MANPRDIDTVNDSKVSCRGLSVVSGINLLSHGIILPVYILQSIMGIVVPELKAGLSSKNRSKTEVSITVRTKSVNIKTENTANSLGFKALK